MYSIRIKPRFSSRRWKSPVTPASNKISITNLVTNGDFSDGTTGWSASGLSTISASNNILSVTTGAWNSGQAYCNSNEFVEGDVYYYKIKARVTTTSCLKIEYFISAGYDGFSQTNPVVNEWYELSYLDTILEEEGGTDGIYYCRHTYGDSVAGRVMEMQYALAINLTKDFGAGSEPTKEQMDTLLSGMTNHWFNGTIEVDPIS